MDAALPRGTRKPNPGPIAGELELFAGKEIEADRRFEEDVDLRGIDELEERAGDENRLRGSSLSCELRREGEVIEPLRLRSMVVDIRRRVSADGASSSSLCVSSE